MKLLSVRGWITVLCAAITVLYPGASSANMYNYCQVPPYVIQNVQPDVMLLLDTSGSMLNFAYYDGFRDPDAGTNNFCVNQDSPCYQYDPDYEYYGYFKSTYWYSYGSNKFSEARHKSAGRPASGGWDGNFLNWLTMRRVDVLRKVMTGGKPTGGALDAEVADCDGRGRFRKAGVHDNATNTYPLRATAVAPVSDDNVLFTVNTAGRPQCDGSGSGTSSFTVEGRNYNVNVVVPEAVEGVLQKVVGTSARIGLTYFAGSEGGYVQVPVGGSNLASAVSNINNKRPDANTPMAEALWTVAGYFAQQSSILGWSPGPRYAPGHYQIGNNVDPLNFGTGGAPRWPRCAKSYVLLITDGEPCADGNLPNALKTFAQTSGRSPYVCQTTANGTWNEGSCSSQPRTVNGTSSPFPAQTFPSCSANNYVPGIEQVALWAHTTDLRGGGIGVNTMDNTQNLNLFIVSAFSRSSTLLQYAAINGGFSNDNGSNVVSEQSQWDENGDGVPDTYFQASGGRELERAIEDAFRAMLRRASSGTAASVLASGEGSGANIIQAVFYPRRRFGNDVIGWTGMLQNLWFYIDPKFSGSSIREDTSVGHSLPDHKLHMQEDYIAQLKYDSAQSKTVADLLRDDTGQGTTWTFVRTVAFEDLKNLWEAGALLWERDLDADPRTIHTVSPSDNTTRIAFSTANASTLQATLGASSAAQATDIIRYVHGYDNPAVDNNGVPLYRNRTVSFNNATHVWKMGDIVNSTPRISTWLPQNSYHTRYFDQTYKAFVDASAYRGRGMVYTGGNDGLLHAFKLGELNLEWPGQNKTLEKARLLNSAPSVPLGKEVWAFAPRNALPYMKYLMDPDYCHTFSVDLTPYIFDASIGDSTQDHDTEKTESSWRTILIGGMRTGGACRNLGGTCTDTGTGTADCVKTPVADAGFSSYFALDITDENNPVLLWEFSHPQLGFAMSGPSVVKVNARNDSGAQAPGRNGHWYVVFGSGPTGPVDNTTQQFLGRSDQNLRYFVVDLKTGALLRTIDTGIPYAFSASIFNSTADTDLDYQDEALYVGYVKRAGSSGAYSWTQGGVGRIVTMEDEAGSDSHADIPTRWVFSRVIDNIGPVTTGIQRLHDTNRKIHWLYFGTGRYFFDTISTSDDPNGQQALYGIKDPCMSQATGRITPTCTDAVTSGLINVTDTANVPTADSMNTDAARTGWYVNLDAAGSYVHDNTAQSIAYRAERVITDPVSTTNGLVFFTTFKPYADECGLGGRSFIWALQYNTGGTPAQEKLKGKALVQVSTASVEQVDLSDAFRTSTSNPNSRGGRRSRSMEGVPPTGSGLSLLAPPTPVKRVLHIRER